MTDMNFVVITARAVRDVELRELADGQVLSAIRLAFSRAKRTADGGWEDVSSFINSFYVGKTPLDVKKGEKVIVSGKLTEHRYTTAEGTERSDMRILIEKLEKIVISKKTEPQAQANLTMEEEIPF